MEFISLFSGVGGFDLGFERAGMRCIAQVETDRFARAVLERHYPDVYKLEDVRHAGKHNLPAASLICGGFPCQDVSIAGHRAGLAGGRSGLWFEFSRLVGEIKPSWVVIENVPGLLSSNGGHDFAVILRGLVEYGYRVAWRVLDAQYFGVPQRRSRLFIVGHLGDGRAAQVLFERESMSRNIAAIQRTRDSYPRIVGTLAASGAGTARPAGQRNELDMLVPVTSSSASPTLLSGTDGSKWGNNQWIRNGHGAIHNGRVRRLTPAECERLQGFPDGWTAGQSDATRYKQMGNAIAVPVAEWIGRRIVLACQSAKKAA